MSCTACGGPATPDADMAYAHTEDCRILRGIQRRQKSAELQALVDQSSLGSIGARALRRYGKIVSGGASHEEAFAALTANEQKAMLEELEEKPLTKRDQESSDRAVREA